MAFICVREAGGRSARLGCGWGLRLQSRWIDGDGDDGLQSEQMIALS